MRTRYIVRIKKPVPVIVRAEDEIKTMANRLRYLIAHDNDAPRFIEEQFGPLTRIDLLIEQSDNCLADQEAAEAKVKVLEERLTAWEKLWDDLPEPPDKKKDWAGFIAGIERWYPASIELRHRPID